MSTVSVSPLPASVRHAELKPPIYSAHLDLLRGTAALIVMFGHLRYLFEDIGESRRERLSWRNKSSWRQPRSIFIT